MALLFLDLTRSSLLKFSIQFPVFAQSIQINHNDDTVHDVVNACFGFGCLLTFNAGFRSLDLWSVPFGTGYLRAWKSSTKKPNEMAECRHVYAHGSQRTPRCIRLSTGELILDDGNG
jgi:hypothetical protein